MDQAPTPLARLIGEEIRQKGPMDLARYMALCLGHEDHGYYTTREPFGRGGDFITAPEVSQMFGEIVGLWCADMWEKIGRPNPVALVELGPGRATLMADILRAARIVPAFARAIRVHLVETSPRLRAIQRENLEDMRQEICWHDRLGQVPESPMLLLANELFDALPAHQLERRQGGWHERVVSVDDTGTLTLSCADTPAPRHLTAMAPATTPEGVIFEIAPARDALALEIGQRLARTRSCALIIDYGHAISGPGDTFQAVAAHKFVSPFERPGEADLTTHVDFEALRRAASQGRASTYGPMEMGGFLQRLGLGARAARLANTATDQTKRDIAAAHHRLTDRREMGSLFKVLALTAPGVDAPAPFDAGDVFAPISEPT